MRLFAILALTLLLCGTAKAGVRFDPLTVHPSNPQNGQPILLLVQSSWNDGCGGALDVRVSSARIDVFQIPNNFIDRLCTRALVPFEEIINPQESLAANAVFANRVEVRFFRRNFNLVDELVDTDIVEFSATPPAISDILSGSFSTRSLDISGLFIDQQEGVLSALLSDYDNQGRSSWRFGAGKMHGNVYLGKLSSYQQVRCVTTPCPRAVADTVGEIHLIALNAKELFVSYRNALSSDVAASAAYRYERLLFNRSATLPSAESLDSWIPDLVGEWLVGVTGSQRENAEFKRYRISYVGGIFTDSNPQNRGFIAVSVTNPSDVFEFICRDDRPVDGDLRCHLSNYRALQKTCDASFTGADVTLGHVRIAAQCDALETEFLMQRLGR
jgi:hypothetical protein